MDSIEQVYLSVQSIVFVGESDRFISFFCRRDLRIPTSRCRSDFPVAIYPTEPTEDFRKLNSPIRVEFHLDIFLGSRYNHKCQSDTQFQNSTLRKAGMK